MMKLPARVQFISTPRDPCASIASRKNRPGGVVEMLRTDKGIAHTGRKQTQRYLIDRAPAPPHSGRCHDG